ncbi:hypothetical protein CRM22_003116 [Opisthorchis felineus]|uniref:Uncharacterized protein n=1 Tax=Opisthorchis felineus TaxID=147828 RepID=A0A4S2M7L1_OPIFE|nr:hypothetical protein CRM22_003116 [Opisthorchis felineus]
MRQIWIVFFSVLVFSLVFSNGMRLDQTQESVWGDFARVLGRVVKLREAYRQEQYNELMQSLNEDGLGENALKLATIMLLRLNDRFEQSFG